MAELYDTIGRGYRRRRRPDPRIGAAILRALGPAASVVNVGAGAGSYEPADRSVIAVEPAITMIRQRPRGAAPVVRGFASRLPFRDASFDASLAILTLHHWSERDRGLSELGRAARRRVVILTWDPSGPGFWIYDYVPEMAALDQTIVPPLSDLRRVLGPCSVSAVPIPHDCSDGFLGAYWRRPAAYLDAGVRSAISSFARVDSAPGLARLERDLASGAWHRRYGHLLSETELDLGYRLVVAGEGATA